MSELYNYYENGTKETFTIAQLQEQFTSPENDEQRENGTTFQDWIDENIQMQIFIPVK